MELFLACDCIVPLGPEDYDDQDLWSQKSLVPLEGIFTSTTTDFLEGSKNSRDIAIDDTSSVQKQWRSCLANRFTLCSSQLCTSTMFTFRLLRVPGAYANVAKFRSVIESLHFSRATPSSPFASSRTRCRVLRNESLLLFTRARSNNRSEILNIWRSSPIFGIFSLAFALCHSQVRRYEQNNDTASPF